MTKKPNEQVMTARTFRRQAVYASVIRSCTKCGAPGYWHNVPDVNAGCYAPEKVTQLGSDPVGPVCPNCGAARPVIEHRGMIWSRVWRVSLWAVIRDAIRNCNPWRNRNENRI